MSRHQTGKDTNEGIKPNKVLTFAECNKATSSTIPQSMAQIFQEDTIILRYFACQIWQKWDCQLSETTIIPWCVCPCMMSEVWINRASYNFCIDFLEFFNTIIECKDFSRAYKCAATIKNKYKMYSLLIFWFWRITHCGLKASLDVFKHTTILILGIKLYDPLIIILVVIFLQYYHIVS